MRKGKNKWDSEPGPNCFDGAGYSPRGSRTKWAIPECNTVCPGGNSMLTTFAYTFWDYAPPKRERLM